MIKHTKEKINCVRINNNITSRIYRNGENVKDRVKIRKNIIQLLRKSLIQRSLWISLDSVTMLHSWDAGESLKIQ